MAGTRANLRSTATGPAGGWTVPAGWRSRSPNATRSLLAALREELGDAAGAQFAAAAQRLAEDFGEVTATAVEAAYETVRDEQPGGRDGRVHPLAARRAAEPLPARPHAPPARPADRDQPPLRPPLRPRRLRHLRPRHQGRGRRRDGAGGRQRGAARQHPHRRRSLPARGGGDLRPRPQPAHGRRDADVPSGCSPSSTSWSGRAACGSRSPPASSPVPTTAPTPISSSTKPTRRCGGRARWASRWASAASPSAERRPELSKSPQNLQDR